MTNTDDIGRRAMKAGGASAAALAPSLVRGHLQIYFFKKWGSAVCIAWAIWFFTLAPWPLDSVSLGWLGIALWGGVAALVVYVLAGVWAAREVKRYRWVDEGNSYRKINKAVKAYEVAHPREVNAEVDARPRNKNREKPQSVTAPYKRPFER